jgi:serine/threonine protein kinase
MAVVFRAVDERLHRNVAVKLMRDGGEIDPRLRARFEAEAHAAAAINHPNVVAVHDVGTDHDVLFIVMERLPGATLADELLRGRMHVEPLAGVLRDVLAGLGAAHASGVLHRDIKPSNILIDTNGTAKLADFGIATTAAMDLTDTGIVIGTPQYLAPERIAGRRATVHSDVYSVGVVAYEALAGARPYTGDSPIALAHAICEGRPRDLHHLRSDVPAALTELIMRAMALAPNRRPRSAAEFARQLEQVLTPDTDATQPVGDTPRTLPTAVNATPEPHAHPTMRIRRRPAKHPSLGTRRRFSRWVAVGFAACAVLGLAIGSLLLRADKDGNGSEPARGVTSTPQPSVPIQLEAPFERLERAVQP